MSAAHQLLIFNAGSSSLKFELIDMSGGAARLTGSYAQGGDGQFRWHGAGAGAPPPAGTLGEAAGRVLDWLSDAGRHGRDLLAGVAASVHRIVHGGEKFRAATLLDAADLTVLAGLGSLAPLHNPAALAVIGAVRARLAGRPLIGVFDTAFYADLPAASTHYAVPERWRTQFGIRRYGFHGMAHRYLWETARRRLQGSHACARLVSLQLGSGCSVTATADGRPRATSMGFTPLAGLVMGTRSGDVDPGALLYVMQHTGMSAADMQIELNEKSGLLGLSGRSADMRELLELERRGDAAAALAVEIFCRRATHYLAAYVAELGGVDVIAFGGGIGENCPQLRRRIVAPLAFAGIEMDAAANAAAVGVAAGIGTAASRAAILVLPVDEAAVMAADADALLLQ